MVRVAHSRSTRSLHTFRPGCLARCFKSSESDQMGLLAASVSTPGIHCTCANSSACVGGTEAHTLSSWQFARLRQFASRTCSGDCVPAHLWLTRNHAASPCSQYADACAPAAKSSCSLRVAILSGPGCSARKACICDTASVVFAYTGSFDPLPQSLGRQGGGAVKHLVVSMRFIFPPACTRRSSAARIGWSCGASSFCARGSAAAAWPGARATRGGQHCITRARAFLHVCEGAPTSNLKAGMAVPGV